MHEIIVWDIDTARIMKIHANLTEALNKYGARALITCNSEPPLLSRMQILNKVPLIEIDGLYWSLKADSEPSAEKLLALLQHIDFDKK